MPDRVTPSDVVRPLASRAREMSENESLSGVVRHHEREAEWREHGEASPQMLERAAFHRGAAASLRQLLDLVRELADDLESETRVIHGVLSEGDLEKMHPSTRRDFERDMEVVHRARRALSPALETGDEK